MKLRAVEIAAISVTAAAIVFVAGFFIGRSNGDRTVKIDISDAAKASSVSVAENDAGEVSSREEFETDGPVNINTADRDELMRLPGVGEVIAERIIEYRSENGSFEKPEELMNVSGIGTSKFNDLREMAVTK